LLIIEFQGLLQPMNEMLFYTVEKWLKQTHYFLYKFEYNIIMALDLMIWGIILGVGLLAYFSSFVFRIPHLFILGCALLIGSGALLWGYDGLITNYYYAEVAGQLVHTPTIIDMTNQGLVMLSLFLVSVPILGALIIDFGGQVYKRKNVYHY
jgi:hypothetical protein